MLPLLLTSFSSSSLINITVYSTNNLHSSLLLKKKKKKSPKQSFDISSVQDEYADYDYDESSNEPITLLDLQNECGNKLDGVIEALKKDFSTIYSGRITPDVLETISCPAYGSDHPLKALGTVSLLPGKATMAVNLFDEETSKDVLNSIRASPLELMPTQQSGDLIHVPIPKPTAQFRKTQISLANTFAESSKQKVRNVRRHFLDKAKKVTPAKDEEHRFQKDIQQLVDSTNTNIIKIFESKSQSIENSGK